MVYVLFAITHGYLSALIEREGHQKKVNEREREEEKKAKNDV